MDIHVRVSYGDVVRILKTKPEVVKCRCTKYLQKRLITHKLIRYNTTDYVCQRRAFDYLYLHVNKPKCVMQLDIVDYWFECHEDINQYPLPPMMVVFKLAK